MTWLIPVVLLYLYHHFCQCFHNTFHGFSIWKYLKVPHETYMYLIFMQSWELGGLWASVGCVVVCRWPAGGGAWLCRLPSLPSSLADTTTSSLSVRCPELGVAQQGVCAWHQFGPARVASRGARRQYSFEFMVSASIGWWYDVLRARTGR
jgi:hypothetical protein